MADTPRAAISRPHLDLSLKIVRASLVKAFGIMIASKDLKMAQNCLTAAAVASAVLSFYGVPHTVKAGYTHMKGAHFSTPHVWIESLEPVDKVVQVTDLTYSGNLREIMALGAGFSFDNEFAAKPVYTQAPMYAIPEKSLSLELLSEQAADLSKYLASAPARLNLPSRVAAIVEQAVDGTPLRISMTPETLSNMGVDSDTLLQKATS